MVSGSDPPFFHNALDRPTYGPTDHPRESLMSIGCCAMRAMRPNNNVTQGGYIFLSPRQSSFSASHAEDSGPVGPICPWFSERLGSAAECAQLDMFAKQLFCLRDCLSSTVRTQFLSVSPLVISTLSRTSSHSSSFILTFVFSRSVLYTSGQNVTMIMLLLWSSSFSSSLDVACRNVFRWRESYAEIRRPIRRRPDSRHRRCSLRHWHRWRQRP